MQYQAVDVDAVFGNSDGDESGASASGSEMSSTSSDVEIVNQPGTSKSRSSASARSGMIQTTLNVRQNAFQVTSKQAKLRLVSQTTENEKLKFDRLLADAIYTNALPLSLVDSPTFAQFIRALRPSYALPSRDQISNSLLDDVYNKTMESTREKLALAKTITLISDGWSNVRNDGI